MPTKSSELARLAAKRARRADKDQDIEEIRRQISALLEKLKDQSEQEVIDQVFKRLVLYLCNTCYLRWIENPTNK